MRERTLLPARFDHAGDFSGERQFPETDPAQFELADKPARAPAPETAVAMPAAQLGLLLGPRFGEPFVSGDLCGSSQL
jgi:hypothetical protein